MKFQVSYTSLWLTFNYSLIVVVTLLTSCRYICLKSPRPSPPHFEIPEHPGYVTAFSHNKNDLSFHPENFVEAAHPLRQTPSKFLWLRLPRTFLFCGVTVLYFNA